jgi:hypothetical protein
MESRRGSRCALLGHGQGPAHVEGKGEGEEWATMDPEGRGRGNGFELARIISSLFLFPKFHITTREKFKSKNKFQGVVPP